MVVAMVSKAPEVIEPRTVAMPSALLYTDGALGLVLMNESPDRKC